MLVSLGFIAFCSSALFGIPTKLSVIDTKSSSGMSPSRSLVGLSSAFNFFVLSKAVSNDHLTGLPETFMLDASGDFGGVNVDEGVLACDGDIDRGFFAELLWRSCILSKTCHSSCSSVFFEIIAFSSLSVIFCFSLCSLPINCSTSFF